MEHLIKWIPTIILGTIGVCSTIATITPNRADNAIVDIVYRIVNIFAMNWGNSKNEIK